MESDKDINNLAKEVIQKNSFGVGKQRKELLGENYDAVQKKVNELMRGSKSSSSSKSKSEKKTKESDYEVKEGNNHYKYKVKKR
jgi:hypothetical protein